ncbi:hypothetical protein AKO1_011873 [Acrasis kona]|uniref:Uncharacterized protein n=1 Tax=Acrasis kona TaxID=1008807 RepID=A0AAW2Z224_9EUKA
MTSTRFGLVSSLIGSLGLFLDLIISHAVDRSHATFRSHLPIILFCAPVWCLSTTLLFYPPHSIPLSVWFTVFSVLKNMVPLETAFNALGAKLTNQISIKDRDSMFAYKQYAGLIGGMAGGFVPYFFSETSRPFCILICSFLLCSSYVIMAGFLRKKEKDKNEILREPKFIPIISGLKRSFENKAYIMLLCLSLFEALRSLLWSGLFPFFFTKVLALDDKEYQLWGGIYNVLGMVLASLFTPLWQSLSRRYGSYRMWLFSYSLQILVGLMVYFIIEPRQQQVYRYLFCFICLCITGRASGFLYDSITASLYDYDEFCTGERREASISASMNIIPRYISLISNSVSFGILSYFEDSVTNAAKCVSVQTTLLPSLTAIICLLIMYHYPIDDEKNKVIKDGIKLHKNGKEAFDPIMNTVTKPPQIDEKDEPGRDHFFQFEIHFFANRKLMSEWFVKTQIVSCFLCSVLCSFCIAQFVRLNVIHKSSDFYSTLALWFASVTFTMTIFFYQRIDAARKYMKHK